MRYEEPYSLIGDKELNLSVFFEKFSANPFSSTIAMRKDAMKKEYEFLANEIITRRFEIQVFEHKCNLYKILVDFSPYLTKKEREEFEKFIDNCDTLTSTNKAKQHNKEVNDFLNRILVTSIHDFVESKLVFLSFIEELKEGIPNDNFNDILGSFNKLASKKKYSPKTTSVELRKMIRWLHSIFEVKGIDYNVKKILPYKEYSYFQKNIMDLYFREYNDLGDWSDIMKSIKSK